MAWTEYEKTVNKVSKKQQAKLKDQREELREYSRKVELTLKTKKDKDEQILNENEERNERNHFQMMKSVYYV